MPKKKGKRARAAKRVPSPKEATQSTAKKKGSTNGKPTKILRDAQGRFKARPLRDARGRFIKGKPKPKTRNKGGRKYDGRRVKGRYALSHFRSRRRIRGKKGEYVTYIYPLDHALLEMWNQGDFRGVMEEVDIRAGEHGKVVSKRFIIAGRLQNATIRSNTVLVNYTAVAVDEGDNWPEYVDGIAVKVLVK
jgi:hypothetical protein